MQLQVGDRFVDETGEWEVVGRPYTSAGGKSAHAHVAKAPRKAGFASRGVGVGFTLAFFTSQILTLRLQY